MELRNTATSLTNEHQVIDDPTIADIACDRIIHIILTVSNLKEGRSGNCTLQEYMRIQ